MTDNSTVAILISLFLFFFFDDFDEFSFEFIEMILFSRVRPTDWVDVPSEDLRESPDVSSSSERFTNRESNEMLHSNQ